MQPRKALKIVVISACSVFGALILFFLFLHSESARGLPLPSLFSSSSPTTAGLHVLIVATSSNLDLCRLLLSLFVLSYPQPVLIDWEGKGEYNASDSHLAKITGTLRYLESLPPSKDKDMVLMLDGFDIFMQLGPDVLLKRYFATKDAARLRLKKQFGEEYVEMHGMHDNILFGPDKTCWPPDPRRAACWVVPESSLRPKAFGTDTDRFADPQLARPLWLNSGTIMGPAADMRKMFAGVTEKINKTFDEEDALKNSDQKYLSDLWADQEYMRMVTRYGEFEVPTPTEIPTALPGIAEPTGICNWEKEKVWVPKLEDILSTDFHIGLDYESRMFQTVAFYEEYLRWITFNKTETFFESDQLQRRELKLPRDVIKSRKPFAAIKDDKRLGHRTWQDTPLGVNVATGHVFPVLHFTGNKVFRDEWWTRMWYFPYAERLLRAASEDRNPAIGSSSIEGIAWKKDVPYEQYEVDEELGTGAWVDKGEHRSWHELCGVHEKLIFSGEMPSRASPEPEPEPMDPCALTKSVQVSSTLPSTASVVAASGSAQP